MRADTWTLPDEHHTISLRARARWERSGRLSPKDLAAIQADYVPLLDGDFDELRDAAASLTTLMFYLQGAGDEISADALHAIILLARPRFDAWRSERRHGEDGADNGVPSTTVRSAPKFGEKPAAGTISLKTLLPGNGLDRARQAATRAPLRARR